MNPCIIIALQFKGFAVSNMSISLNYTTYFVDGKC